MDPQLHLNAPTAIRHPPSAIRQGDAYVICRTLSATRTDHPSARVQFMDPFDTLEASAGEALQSLNLSPVPSAQCPVPSAYPTMRSARPEGSIQQQTAAYGRIRKPRRQQGDYDGNSAKDGCGSKRASMDKGTVRMSEVVQDSEPRPAWGGHE